MNRSELREAIEHHLDLVGPDLGADDLVDHLAAVSPSLVRELAREGVHAVVAEGEALA